MQDYRTPFEIIWVLYTKRWLLKRKNAIFFCTKKRKKNKYIRCIEKIQATFYDEFIKHQTSGGTFLGTCKPVIKRESKFSQIYYHWGNYAPLNAAQL